MIGFDCIAALKALGEETRLRILRLLFKEQLSVNEITLDWVLFRHDPGRVRRPQPDPTTERAMTP